MIWFILGINVGIGICLIAEKLGKKPSDLIKW